MVHISLFFKKKKKAGMYVKIVKAATVFKYKRKGFKKKNKKE